MLAPVFAWTTASMTFAASTLTLALWPNFQKYQFWAMEISSTPMTTSISPVSMTA